jgi:hypothetical protein
VDIWVPDLAAESTRLDILKSQSDLLDRNFIASKGQVALGDGKFLEG